MIRTATLAGLTLAVLAVAGPAQDAKAKVYKTPQEVFDGVFDALEKKQAQAMADCLTPDALRKTIADMVFDGMKHRSAKNEPKDKDKPKDLKPLMDVLDKHGLTEAATKDFAPKGPRPTKAEREAVVKLVKTPNAFFLEYAETDFKVNPRSKDDAPKPTLGDLKIDGNKATGMMVLKFKFKIKEKVGDKEVEKEVEREFKSPVAFEKLGDGWRIDPDVEAPEEQPKDKKDK